MSTADATQDVALPRAETRRKAKKPRQGQHPLIWLAVIAIVLFCLFPFSWLINVSLKTGADLSGSSLVPPHPSLDNYKSIFQNSNFTRALGNSAIVALTTTLIGVIVGSFAA